MISKKSQAYGQALFELEASEEWLQQLKALAGLFKEREIQGFFLSLAVPEKDKKRILTQALKPVSGGLKNFFFVLADNRAFASLPQIALAYQELMEEKAGRLSGTVYSPCALSTEQMREIESRLEKFFKKKTTLDQKEDKSLVGGVCVHAGGFVFDSSAQRQLQRFKFSGG